MVQRFRQENLNVYLAQELQKRDIVSAPEVIMTYGVKHQRHIPDVLVNYQGLRLMIEGEIADTARAEEKAVASARRRVEIGVAHMGVAVVYPAQLREGDPVTHAEDVAGAELIIRVITEAGESGSIAGSIDALGNLLRRSYEELIREDVVAEAVAILDAGIDDFVLDIALGPGQIMRIGGYLGFDMSELPKDDNQREIIPPELSSSIIRIAGLVMVNALIFQEMLAQDDKRIMSLEKVLGEAFPKLKIAEVWLFILDNINYYSIFHIAREIITDIKNQEPILKLITTAIQITIKKAALRHDLMGRVYHRLLADAKYLGTFYTAIPSATLLLKLSLSPARYPLTWHNPEEVSQLRIADLSCGTGTLLMASADAVTDNYLNIAAAEGVVAKSGTIQKILAEDIIYGYDVLPSAVHLTASTLASRAPEVLFEKMNLFSLPLGGQFHRLGSVEFLLGREVQMPLDIFGALPETQQVTANGVKDMPSAPMPDLDLCVMNPPFTRSVGGNLLFGSVAEPERKKMQKKLQKILQQYQIQANTTAGLGSIFVAIGDRYIKEGGRIALVLPKALFSGIAWEKTRELINSKYDIEFLIASHDADRWNFSDSTDLSEVMLLAKKRKLNGDKERPKAIAVNLRHNPRNNFEALTIASLLNRQEIPDLVEGQGALELGSSTQKYGEAIAVDQAFTQGNWLFPCSFAQVDLIRVAHYLMQGKLWLPGQGQLAEFPLNRLDEFGVLGPDRRDIHDGFNLAKGKAITSYAAFWGHNAKEVTTLSQEPNQYLNVVSKAKKNRPFRKVESLWPLSGRVLIADRLWLKTQRVSAIYVNRRVLSNVWWSFSMKKSFEQAEYEKALIMWLNSTPGILLLLPQRIETRGAWIEFKKPRLAALPVLDIRKLTSEQLTILSEAYDRVAEKEMLPFPQMAQDEVRAAIDSAIAKALDLPDFSDLRMLLAQEPIICMKKLV